MKWPWRGLKPGHYGVLLADPPWSFKTYSGHGTPHRGDKDHYPVLDRKSLAALPVSLLAAPDCALFMWVVDSNLDEALALGAAWGFTYKTRAFEWVKTTCTGKYALGMGYWTRKQTESCLLFTRGRPQRLSRAVRQLIVAERREHSRKPDEQYAQIEALVGGPYCELFARRRQPGWDGWGNEYPEGKIKK